MTNTQETELIAENARLAILLMNQQQWVNTGENNERIFEENKMPAIKGAG